MPKDQAQVHKAAGSTSVGSTFHTRLTPVPTGNAGQETSPGRGHLYTLPALHFAHSTREWTCRAAPNPLPPGMRSPQLGTRRSVRGTENYFFFSTAFSE